MRLLVLAMLVGCQAKTTALPALPEPELVASCESGWEPDARFELVAPDVWRFQSPAMLDGCAVHLNRTTLRTTGPTPTFEGSYTICNACNERQDVSWVSIVARAQELPVEEEQLGVWPLLRLIDDRGRYYLAGCRQMSIRPSEGSKYGIRRVRIAAMESIESSIEQAVTDFLDDGVPQDTSYWESPLDYRTAAVDALFLPKVGIDLTPFSIKKICHEAGILPPPETGIGGEYFSLQLSAGVALPDTIRDHLAN